MKVLQGVQGKGPEQGEEAPAVLGPLFSPCSAPLDSLRDSPRDSLGIPQAFPRDSQRDPRDSLRNPSGFPEGFPRNSPDLQILCYFAWPKSAECKYCVVSHGPKKLNANIAFFRLAQKYIVQILYVFAWPKST